MSGGAGHIMDMISRIRGNSGLRKNRGYFGIKEEYLKISNQQGYNYKNATPEQLEAVRSELRRQVAMESKRITLVIVLSVILALALLALVSFFIAKVF